MTTPTGQLPHLHPFLAPLASAGVIAVLRAPTVEAALHATEALVAGGITGIEITFSTPRAPDVIDELASRHGEAVQLGAGTVLTPAQAREAVDAGARFLVSPGTDPNLTPVMLSTGAAVLTGALSPSEVMAATALGTHAVKLFPASLGGPSYLRSLRGPFPTVQFTPTGGVTPENLGEWFRAGAFAVGAGSELCPAASMRDGDWPGITSAAVAFTAALRRTRQERP